MTMNDVADRLEFITIGDATYLGLLDGNVVKYAVRRKDGCIADWFKAFNINETKTITMGPATGYAVTPLTRNQRITVDTLKAKMAYVKTAAIGYLENDMFTKNI